MGWRQKMGAKVETGTHTINTINPKNGADQAFSSISSINSKGSENEKGYPIPTTEMEFAMDERQAIIDVDGGQDAGSVEYPVIVKMNSSILGAAVDVLVWPDRAMVDGVNYLVGEIKDLISRGPPAADLRAVHEIKKSFDGEVMPEK